MQCIHEQFCNIIYIIAVHRIIGKPDADNISRVAPLYEAFDNMQTILFDGVSYQLISIQPICVVHTHHPLVVDDYRFVKVFDVVIQVILHPTNVG